MTVSIAVTNSASICSPMNVPRMAKIADDHDDVVDECDDRRDAHPEVAEAEGDPEHDAERAHDDEQERLLDELRAHDRADGVLLAHLVDGPEAVPAGRLRASPSAPGRGQALGRRRRATGATAAPDGAGAAGEPPGAGDAAAGDAAADAERRARRRRPASHPARSRHRVRPSAGGRRGAGGRPRREAGARCRCRLRLDEGQRGGPDEHVLAGPPAVLMATSDPGRPCSTRTAGRRSGRACRRGSGPPRRCRRCRRWRTAGRAWLPGRSVRQDEDETGDRDREAERVEPAALADDVKHARSPRAARGRGVATRNSSSRTPKSWRWRAQGWRTTQRSIIRLRVMAVNIEVSTPMMSTRAKPLTIEVPKYHRMHAVMSVDTLESKIEFQARLKPGLDGRGQGLARTQLLLGPLEDEDVGVHGHAHREHERRRCRPASGSRGMSRNSA